MLSINLVSISPTYGTSFKAIGFGYLGPSGKRPASIEPGDLSVPWHDLQENPSIFSLLSWHTAISKFKGREEELIELDGWAMSSQAISVKFISGAGGMGKSRLAAEFATRLQKRNWAAGFVDLRKSQSFRLHKEGTLLIIDYPEENHAGVNELFRDLYNLPSSERFRLLFLTRQQITDWHEVIHDTRIASLVDMVPIHLSDLDVSAAHEIYLSVSEQAGEVYNTEWKPLDEKTMESWLEEAEENDRALFVVAAAVHNALNPDDEAVRYDGRKIVESLVERELSRFRNLARQCRLRDTYIFAYLFAMATIAERIPANRIDAILEQTNLTGKIPNKMDIARELENLGLLVDREIHALKPDIVAAAFVVKIFSQVSDIATELIWTALKEDIDGGLKRISRLSYDAEVVLAFHEHRLSKWLAQTVSGNVNRSNALNPLFAIDNLPFGLINTRISICRTLLPITAEPAKKARLLNNLSVDLSISGDIKGALDTVLEAIKIYTRLDTSNPNTFVPDLARSHNNLGLYYSGLGQHVEALEGSKKAVEIYTHLAASNPEAFEPDLASSLTNLGNHHLSLSHHEEALEASKKAVEIYARLADSNPATFNHDFATSLNNLGLLYSDLGQSSKALEAAKLALEIRKPLAASNPDAFEPDLAICLNNLGLHYSDLNLHVEAFEASKQAVEIYTRLARSNPNAFDPDLAMSLGNLGARYSNINQHTEALETSKQAVEIYTRLAQSNPQAFESNLAMNLTNLGSRYSELDQHTEALEASKQAAKIHERLSDLNPKVFAPVLARSLGAIGEIYRKMNQNQKSLESFKRGLALLKPMFLKNPEPFANLIIQLKNNYLEMCKNTNSKPDKLLVHDIVSLLEKKKWV